MKVKLALVMAFMAVAAGAAGTSWGYFKTGANGTGTALVGSGQPVTLTPATPTSALYPGGSADLALTVSNTNGGAVMLPSLALDTTRGTNGLAVDSAHAGCDLSAVTFTGSASGWMIPAHAAAYPIDLPGAMSMESSAADTCQGATFTVYLQAGP